MNLKKAMTIELDVNDITLPKEYIKKNIGEIMTKYNFSIVENSNEEKLSMIVQEFITYKNILIGFAGYNFSDIQKIDTQLRKQHTFLNAVYIPSSLRIEKRIEEAKKTARLHGRWIGSDEDIVEKNFKKFKEILQEIKDGSKKESFNVIEC